MPTMNGGDREGYDWTERGIIRWEETGPVKTGYPIWAEDFCTGNQWSAGILAFHSFFLLIGAVMVIHKLAINDIYSSCGLPHSTASDQAGTMPKWWAFPLLYSTPGRHLGKAKLFSTGPGMYTGPVTDTGCSLIQLSCLQIKKRYCFILQLFCLHVCQCFCEQAWYPRTSVGVRSPDLE